jgi:hypothetical protein
LFGLVAAAGAAAGPLAPERAEPPLPVELQYVPPDAALFLHFDAAGLWSSDLVGALRNAKEPTFGRFEEAVRAFGLRPVDLKSVVLFAPQLKGPDDGFAVVLTSAVAIDKDKLTRGVRGALPKDAKFRVVVPSEKTAVVLVGVGDEYGKPQPAGADGPLAPAIRAAASGQHTLVAGATLANLPDRLRRDDEVIEAFRPLARARSVTAQIDLGKSFNLDVRVRTAEAAQARDAEKALAALVKLFTSEGEGGLPALKKRGQTETDFEDLAAVLEASIRSAKRAKFAVDGTEARLTATLPLDGLPVAAAWRAASAKLIEDANAVQSLNNLKQIGIAMHVYNEKYGRFPPAAVCDKKGKPQLSWRVLILPHIEQEELFKQFKLDEPWDSDTNKKLLAKMPSTYALPGKTKPGGTDTFYRVFVGNGAGFEWIQGMQVGDITDGLANTLMVATAAESVPWTKPDELAFDPEKDMTKLIGPAAAGRPQLLYYDGSARSPTKPILKDALHRLITRGEGIPTGNICGR